MGYVTFDRKRATYIANNRINWQSWGARSGWDRIWTQIRNNHGGQLTEDDLLMFESVVYRIKVTWGDSQALTGLSFDIPFGENGRAGQTAAIVRVYLYTFDPTPGYGQSWTKAPSGYVTVWSPKKNNIPEVPGVSTQYYETSQMEPIKRPTSSTTTSYLYLWITAIYDVTATPNEGVNVYVVHSVPNDYGGETIYGDVYATFQQPIPVIVSYRGNDADGTITYLPSSGTVLYGDPISSQTPRNTYVIGLDANGGTVGAVSSTSVDSTRAFNNWNTSSDGSGATWTPGQTINQTQNLTLYAQWGRPTTVNLPVATRAGYDFLGWGTEKNANILYNGTYTPTRQLTLYANWKRKGAIHIYSSADSSWHSYLVWIYTGDSGGPNHDGWHHAIPMVYSGSKFHTCG